MSGMACSGVRVCLWAGLLLIMGFPVDAAASRHPRVRVVSVSVARQTPADDHLELTLTLEDAHRDDQLAITIQSFATCSATVPRRADRHVELFDDAVAARTLVRRFVLPRAARHEATVTLISTDGAFGTTHETTDFGSTRKGCR
jgi:hypothetical protein